MEEGGYGPEACYFVDKSFIGFVRRWEQMRDATDMVEMEARPKDEKPKVPQARYSKDQLLIALDLDPRDEESTMSDIVMQAVDASMWNFYDADEG